MPYKNIGDLPSKITKTFEDKGYNTKEKQAWIKAFNSAYESYDDEGKAYGTAWKVANDMLAKRKGSFKEWLFQEESGCDLESVLNLAGLMFRRRLTEGDLEDHTPQEIKAALKLSEDVRKAKKLGIYDPGAQHIKFNQQFLGGNLDISV